MSDGFVCVDVGGYHHVCVVDFVCLFVIVLINGYDCVSILVLCLLCIDLVCVM